VFFLHSPSAKKTLGKENFKSKFEALNKFKSKNFELQSCITSQDLFEVIQMHGYARFSM